MAASNTTNWAVNDGCVSVEAVDSNHNRNSFSHTRVYDVTAGSYTFYAVAQNYVETNGTGTASIYGSLTVEFIPQGQSLVGFTGISQAGVDVRTGPAVVGQVTIDPATSGKVIVHFDGVCISSPGDRIILAASNTTNWAVNDGCVSVEAVDSNHNGNSFSHTRVYDVTAGSYTFYAVAQNYVETNGTGTASIYGSLTAEFIPDDTNSINEIGNNQYDIYPNPTNNFLNINGLNQNAILTIYSVSGKTIKKVVADKPETNLDISSLEKGVYFINIFSDNKHNIVKFIKK